MEHLGTDISLPLPSELKATLVRWQWSSCSARSHERQMAGADWVPMDVFPGLLQMIIMGISMTSLPGNSQHYYRIEGFLSILTPLLTMRIKGYPPNEQKFAPRNGQLPKGNEFVSLWQHFSALRPLGFYGDPGNLTNTWMSQEVSKWLVNGLFHLLTNGMYWGYNPLTKLLLTSWNFQVGLPKRKVVFQPIIFQRLC